MNTLVFLYVLGSIYTVDVKPMPDYKTCRAAQAVLEKATAEQKYNDGPNKTECYIVDESKGGFVVISGRDLELQRQSAELDRLSRETTVKLTHQVEVNDPSKSVKLQQFLKDQENAHE